MEVAQTVFQAVTALSSVGMVILFAVLVAKS